MKKIADFGYHLYIRDYSYLGIPAYSVIIPEIVMSDMDGVVQCYRNIEALSDEVKHKEATDEQYEKLLPILQFLEKKQEEFYL